MKASKNSIAQALKLADPTISRKHLLMAIDVPDCMTANMRYWYGTYNILPWNHRKAEEQTAAMAEAQRILALDAMERECLRDARDIREARSTCY